MSTSIYQNAHINAVQPYYVMLNGHRYNAAYYNGELMWGIKTSPIDPTGDFLKFSSPSSNAAVGISNVNNYQLKTDQKFYYSFDKRTWTEYTTYGTLITIPQNGYVYWYGTKGLGYWYDSYLHFVGNAHTINCSGNIMSLCGENWKDLLVVEAGQFECGFKNFTTLATAPKLPATTVQEAGYGMMFEGCTSLVESPEIPDGTFGDGAMMRMFYGCSSLSTIKCLVTNLTAFGVIDEWTYNVSASGTFYKTAGVTWPTGTSGIPTGWTVVEV